MSAVLESRLLECLRGYGVTHPNLTDEELASELLGAVLPAPDDEGDDPMWRQTIYYLNVCFCCLYTECHCCYGCGQPDADIIGKHGSWCAL